MKERFEAIACASLRETHRAAIGNERKEKVGDGKSSNEHSDAGEKKRAGVDRIKVVLDKRGHGQLLRRTMMKRGLLGRPALGGFVSLNTRAPAAMEYVALVRVQCLFCHMPEPGIHVAGAVGCATGSSSAAQG